MKMNQSEGENDEKIYWYPPRPEKLGILGVCPRKNFKPLSLERQKMPLFVVGKFVYTVSFSINCGPDVSHTEHTVGQVCHTLGVSDLNLLHLSAKWTAKNLKSAE